MKPCLAALLFICVAAPSFAQQPDSSRNRVVPQQDAPVAISSYNSAYSVASRYTSQGIEHNLRYTNTSKRPIIAIEFGLVSFSTFNDFVDRTYGTDRQIDKKFQDGSKDASGTWMARALNEHSHWTGVTWVNRVRFDNGEIWKADDRAIVEELKKIQADFDASVLAPDAWKKTTQP